MIAAFLLGLLTWSLVEYVLHRYLLHHLYPGDHLSGHHKTPTDYTIGPSWLSVAGYFFAFLGVVAVAGAWVFYLGVVVGFVFYAVMHRLCHHRLSDNWLLRKLRRNHNVHHFKDEDANFGVSSPLWDIVFGTYQ